MQLLKILLLVTLVGVAGCESREAARRRQVEANLKQIGLALHAYNGQVDKPESDNEATPTDDAPTAVVPISEDKPTEAAESRPSVPV